MQAPSLAQRIKYERARRSFAEFARQAWPFVESNDLEWNWHLDVIADHLEAVKRGEIRRLLVNMPPRCLKSTFINVLWPTWMWGDLPHFKYLTSSYADELSVRDNVKSRDLILTPWYQGYLRHMELEGHGEVWRLKGDQNVKSRYENNRGGHRIATSVGGSATGDGGDAVMVDEAGVEIELAALGYTIVRPETSSAAELIRLFAEADLVEEPLHSRPVAHVDAAVRGAVVAVGGEVGGVVHRLPAGEEHRERHRRAVEVRDVVARLAVDRERALAGRELEIGRAHV